MKRLSNSFVWVVTTIGMFRNWPEIYWNRFRHPGKPLRLELRSGTQFVVSHKNSMMPIVLEIWKRKVYGSLSELSTIPEPVVIDIGSHIGAFALYALSKAPKAQIYAYEPDATNVNCLRQNVILNKAADRIHVFDKAVSGAGGKRKMFVKGNTANHSFFNYEGDVRTTTEVECVTLADIFTRNKIDNCDLLKIDAEGAEYEILMDSDPAIFSKIKEIMLEWHDYAGGDPDELATFLRARGYEVKAAPKVEMPVEGFIYAHRT